MKINKILVPVDFSESSVNGLNWACHFAEKIHAELILFHAFELKKSYYENVSFNDPTVITKDLKDEKKERLKELALHTGYKKKISFEYIAESGNFQKTLKEVVDKNKIDIVIIGSEGAENQRNYLFGSNTIEIIKKNGLPLLIVPQKMGFSKIDKIVFATSFSIENLEPILFLAKLSDELQASLTLLHIASEDIETEEKRLTNYQRLIAKNNPGKTIHFELLYHETILDGINEYVLKNQVDLLAVYHRIRHNFFDDFFNPSLSEDLALFTAAPVIVFSNESL